jgi:magnesium-transporting ATPase (P-type)
VVVPSILLALVTLAAFGVTLARDPENLHVAQSAAFVTLALAHLGMAWPLRNLRGSALTMSPLTNPLLLASFVVGGGLLPLLLYTGPGQALFHTYPLDLVTWALVPVLTPVPLLGAEIVKAVIARSGR